GAGHGGAVAGLHARSVSRAHAARLPRGGAGPGPGCAALLLRAGGDEPPRRRLRRPPGLLTRRPLGLPPAWASPHGARPEASGRTPAEALPRRRRRALDTVARAQQVRAAG